MAVAEAKTVETAEAIGAAGVVAVMPAPLCLSLHPWRRRHPRRDVLISADPAAKAVDAAAMAASSAGPAVVAAR